LVEHRPFKALVLGSSPSALTIIDLWEAGSGENGAKRAQMNDTQLYLSIGIPTLTVILAWLASRADLHREVDKLDRRLDRMEGRLDSLNSEMIALRRDIYGEMVALHERMARLEAPKS
jgi:hypothetical protein